MLVVVIVVPAVASPRLASPGHVVIALLPTTTEEWVGKRGAEGWEEGEGEGVGCRQTHASNFPPKKKNFASRELLPKNTVQTRLICLSISDIFNPYLAFFFFITSSTRPTLYGI